MDTSNSDQSRQTSHRYTMNGKRMESVAPAQHARTIVGDIAEDYR